MTGTQMSKIETRRLDVERDQQGLFMLFAQVFGHYVTPEMWRWKYVPEWADTHQCWVARAGDRVVGFLGAMPLRGLIGGNEAPFFQIADVMVHPEFRGQHDWFDLATNHILDDITAHHPQRVIYGFSNHRSFLWLKKLGICDLVEQPRTCYVEPNAPMPRRSTTDLDCIELDWHDDEFDRHWQALRGTVHTGLMRDGTYLRWRYASHPHYAYRPFSLRCDGEPVGFCVIEGGKKKERTTIIDALLPAEHRTGMLAAMAKHFDKPARTWFAAPHTPELPDLRPTKTNVYTFVKETTLSIEAIRKDLYFTMGDADWW